MPVEHSVDSRCCRSLLDCCTFCFSRRPHSGKTESCRGYLGSKVLKKSWTSVSFPQYGIDLVCKAAQTASKTAVCCAASLAFKGCLLHPLSTCWLLIADIFKCSGHCNATKISEAAEVQSKAMRCHDKFVILLACWWRLKKKSFWMREKCSWFAQFSFWKCFQEERQRKLDEKAAKEAAVEVRSELGKLLSRGCCWAVSRISQKGHLFVVCCCRKEENCCARNSKHVYKKWWSEESRETAKLHSKSRRKKKREPSWREQKRKTEKSGRPHWLNCSCRRRKNWGGRCSKRWYGCVTSWLPTFVSKCFDDW